MKKLLLLAVVLAIASCKKGDDAAKGPSCADAISKAVATLPAGPATAIADRLKGVLITRCTEDKWSPEVIACYGAVTGQNAQKEMTACREKLPPELAQKARAEIQRAMLMSGAMGGGGHGAAPKVPVPDTAAGNGSAGGAMGNAGKEPAAPAGSGETKP
jgi:hypothetical protein